MGDLWLDLYKGFRRVIGGLVIYLIRWREDREKEKWLKVFLNYMIVILFSLEDKVWILTIFECVSVLGKFYVNLGVGCVIK